MRLLLTSCVLAVTAGVFFVAANSTQDLVGPDVVAEVNANLAQAEASLASAKSEHQNAAAALQQTIADLEADRDGRAGELDALASERAELDARVADLTSQLAAVEAERSDLASRLSGLEAEQGAATAAAEATIQSLNETVSQARAEQDTLQTRITELESLAADGSATQGEGTAELEAELAARTEALAAAEAQIASMTEQAASQDQTLSGVNGQIADLETALAASEDKIASLEEEAVRLADTLEERETAIAALQPSAAPVAICQDRSDAVLADASIDFEAGTTSLAADSIPLLQSLAEVAVDCAEDGLTLSIEGHTDGLGGEASSVLLSNGRAMTVYGFLEAEGVPASALRAVGLGGSEPVADSATEEGQLQNERIVLHWLDR